VSGVVRAWRGVREIVLLCTLWGIYSLSRLLASTDLGPAARRAASILDLERITGLDVELGMNRFTAAHDWLSAAASYYYAAAHYLVTGVVLALLWTGGRQAYRQARQALVLATVLALTAYLTVPTAPPRFLPGYADVLADTADLGWWNAGQSLPGTLGRLTNDLAAMPSMHAGWALWVALAVQLFTEHRSNEHRSNEHRLARGAAWAHAGLTALVVIGTGNHWTLDVLTGWLVTIAAWALVSRRRHRPGHADRAGQTGRSDQTGQSASAAGW